MFGARILITQTGSLPRTSELTEALRGERQQGMHRSAAVREKAVAAVRSVVARQIETGIDIVGDGEQGRVGFQIYVPQRMTGFGGESERNPPSDLFAFPKFSEMLRARLGDGEATVDPPAAIGDVHYEGEQEAHEDAELLVSTLADLRDPSPEGFMTAPSPGIVAATFRNKHYDSYEDYVRKVAAELRKEYQVIIDAGLVLQIDAPDLAMERTMYFTDRSLHEFVDAIDLHVDVLNSALAGMPRDRLRLHCCWGNHESPHTDDVELADVLPIISRAQVSALGIAFANPRHQHEIEVIARHGLPGDMKLIAGVVDTTTNYVEHPEVVSQRLQAAVRAMGDVGRVIGSPDCGFGTFAGYELVASDVVWAKLETLRQGADLAAAAL